MIAYVRRRYGDDNVAQIITFGSFLARGVMRNAGRVILPFRITPIVRMEILYSARSSAETMTTPAVVARRASR